MSDVQLSAPQKLSAEQRRVLGVLVEKSLTTPDAYPMTINAIVAGCNQKSNRLPLVQYDADDVEMALDQLREADFVNVVITSGGHVERYRQLSRIVFGWSDQHVAIMAELLLRGRQAMGELRSRASRMITIDSLEVLRTRLRELADAGFIASSGPLERRGVEVDHLLYEESGHELPNGSASQSASTPTPPSAAASFATTESIPTAGARPELDALKADVETLKTQVESLHRVVDDLTQKLDSVL